MSTSRGGGIRTRALLRPRQARYQAALRPGTPGPSGRSRERSYLAFRAVSVKAAGQALEQRPDPPEGVAPVGDRVLLLRRQLRHGPPGAAHQLRLRHEERVVAE